MDANSTDDYAQIQRTIDEYRRSRNPLKRFCYWCYKLFVAFDGYEEYPS